MGRFLHFSDEDSVWLYQKSIAVEPRYLRTHVFLAETYEKMGREEEARKEYQFCVELPDHALAGMEPENRWYKEIARKRLAKL